jgi:hypothetical protein
MIEDKATVEVIMPVVLKPGRQRVADRMEGEVSRRSGLDELPLEGRARDE